MLDSCKMLQKQFEAVHTFFWHFFQVQNRILWHIVLLKCQIAFLKFTSCEKSDFSRVYSNSFCSCSFECEIIRNGQSSHKMYSNNILNFQESTTILNAHTKKSLETYRMHLVYGPVKIYKQHNSLQSIISQVIIPIYELTKHVNQLIPPYIARKTSLKSSHELIQLLQTFET